VHRYATLLQFHVVIGFHGFLLICFLAFPLCFDSWELVCGRGKVNGDSGEMCGTQLVMKD